MMKRSEMSGSKQQRTAPITSASRLSPPSTRLTTRHPTPDTVPLWFHGLLARSVAEELLLKNPNSAEGLFLVRQSSNRGGHFVISVCSGSTVNHYLVETLESMFYVRRDRCEERGRDIQARDLCSLVQCYQGSPLDESGLILKEGLLRTIPITVTAPLTAMTRSKINHNYIPLHMDNREYIALEEFTAGDDLQALSFRKGEVLTVLQKESKNWWFACSSQQDLGYIPASLVCNLKEWQQKCKNSGAFCNLGCSDTDDVFVSNREKTEESLMQRQEERKCLLDINSNVLGVCGCPASRPASPIRSSSSPSLRENGYSNKETICVSTDYIAMCLRQKEHQKLCEMQRVFDARLSQQLSPCQRKTPSPSSIYGSQSPPDCRRDLKPRILLRSQTEPANIHSAPPSPHRRAEDVSTCPRLSKENIPCLLVNAVSVDELSSSNSPGRSNCNNKQCVPPRSPATGLELKLRTCLEEGEGEPTNTDRSSQSDGKLAKLEDTIAANGEIPIIRIGPKGGTASENSYDPIATYLRLAECTTGPQSSVY